MKSLGVIGRFVGRRVYNVHASDKAEKKVEMVDVEIHRCCDGSLRAVEAENEEAKKQMCRMPQVSITWGDLTIRSSRFED